MEKVDIKFMYILGMYQQKRKRTFLKNKKN